MKKLRIGIVGLNFGEKIVEELKKGYGSSYFEVAAVCDINAERVAEVSENTGIKAYISIDDLLMEKDIPVIGLFVPPAGRADLIEKIILTECGIQNRICPHAKLKEALLQYRRSQRPDGTSRFGVALLGDRISRALPGEGRRGSTPLPAVGH